VSRLARAVTIDDLRRLAQRRLPRAVFDFVEGGGAGDERTVARNRAAFERLLFHPRAFVDVSKWEQAAVVLGERVATPVLGEVDHTLALVGVPRVADLDRTLVRRGDEP